MIHILLFILKILGVILLVIFSLTLLLLIFPIAYVGNAQAKETDVHGTLSAGWLFHLVHFGLHFQGSDVTYHLRVLGIPVYRSGKTEEDAQNGKTQQTENTAAKENDADELPQQEDAAQIEKKEIQSDISNSIEKEIPVQHQQASQKRRKKKRRKKRDKKLSDKIKALYQTCRAFLEDAINHAKETGQKVKKIKKFVTANTTKKAYRRAKILLIRLLRHVLPRKIRADVVYGLAEPDATGQVYGYLAMAYGTLGINPKHIRVQPCFTQKMFEGTVKVRGHLFLGKVLILALKFYFNREIHAVIKYWQRRR